MARPALVAKTKLVDGIRVNKADDTIAQQSSRSQQKQVDSRGLEQGKTYTPTVISDTTIRDQKIPEIKSEANKLLPGPQGTAQNPGDQPQGVSGSETEPANEYDQLYQSVMGSSPQDDSLYDAEMNMLNNMQKTSDARTQASIRALSDTYNARRAETKAATSRGSGAAQTMLMAGGGYRSGSSQSLLSGIERAGIRQLSTLDAEEQSLKADALAAQTENDYKTLGAKLDLLKEKRAEKLQTVSEMWSAKVEEDKERNKEINSVMKLAAENGASKETLSAIAGATTAQAAYEAAGESLIKAGSFEEKAYRDALAKGYSGSALDYHRAWTSAGRASTSGSGTGSGGSGTGYNGDYAGTISRAANKMGSVTGSAQMKTDLENSIAAGDFTTAAGLIVDAATAGLTAEGRGKVQNAAIDDYMLTQMRDALQAYQDAGGNMNIFKGTADDIGKSIGVLVNDPEYAEIGSQLDRAFQQFRQNMTGAAFGAQESAEYAKVLPQKSNNLDLNLATINGALSYNNNYVKGAIRAATGDGGLDIYERGRNKSVGPAQELVQQDIQAQDAISSWVAQDEANMQAFNEFMTLFPDADALTVKAELEI